MAVCPPPFPPLPFGLWPLACGSTFSLWVKLSLVVAQVCEVLASLRGDLEAKHLAALLGDDRENGRLELDPPPAAAAAAEAPPQPPEPAAASSGGFGFGADSFGASFGGISAEEDAAGWAPDEAGLAAVRRLCELGPISEFNASRALGEARGSEDAAACLLFDWIAQGEDLSGRHDPHPSPAPTASRGRGAASSEAASGSGAAFPSPLGVGSDDDGMPPLGESPPGGSGGFGGYESSDDEEPLHSRRTSNRPREPAELLPPGVLGPDATGAYDLG